MRHQRYKVEHVIRNATKLEDHLNEVGSQPGWRVFEILDNGMRFVVISEQEMSKGDVDDIELLHPDEMPREDHT